MSAYQFGRDAVASADESWRPLDRAVHRWVRAHGEGPGTDFLAETAAWASLADGHGDSALDLANSDGRHAMAPLDDTRRQLLREHPLVGDDSSEKPFVIDAANRFYLQRNHRNERGAAAALRARREAKRRFKNDVSDADIARLFRGASGSDVEPQQRAVRVVGEAGIFVLTGAPGTGKTTTVLQMLLMVQLRSERALDIVAAAPTGKAAQRLMQALRAGKQRLLDDTAPQFPVQWRDYLDAIPDSDALTLHRLLGFEPWRNGFSANARNPLAADVVVVDEASMIDLAMLRTLLDALRPDALLILVGDADQLTSVATGSVLMDLVAAMESSATSRDVVRLLHGFRARPQLVSINDAVRRGDSTALGTALANASDSATVRDVHNATSLRDCLRAWAQRLMLSLPSPVVLTSPFDADADFDHVSTVEKAFAALARQQLLCALREGPYGAREINDALEHQLRAAWNVPVGSEWYQGRAVIITRNDYAEGLFNGDVGICLAAADGALRVWFEVSVPRHAVGTTEPGYRDFAPSALPDHERAFALTIHKSQGSEYQHVAVVLPPESDHRILSRQLLYTALSRARDSVEIWSSAASLEAAVRTSVRRAGGLADRLVRAD